MKHPVADTDQISGRHLDWQLFRRFLSLVYPHRAIALWALLLLPLISTAKLIQPYLLLIAIDRHIVPGDLEGLWRVAGYFLLALVAEGTLLFFQSYLVQSVGQRIMADLRREGYRRLLRLPVPYFDRHPSGRLVTRLTGDVDNVGELFGAGVVSALGDLLTLVLAVAAMLWLDVRLSLIAFAVLPPLLVLLLIFRRAMREAMRQVRARVAGLNAFIAERIAGASEVRLFGQEERTLAEFAGLQEGYRRSAFRVVTWDAVLYAVIEVLGALVVAALLWRGGVGVMLGVATFGTLVAMIEYVQKFFSPLLDLSAKYSVLQASNASLERIFELLDHPVEPGGEKAPGGSEVRFSGVTFSYDAKTPVLHGIDLTVNEGETLALVGETGSGKTTLGRLLLRFYEPSAGRIELGGKEITLLDPSEVRRRVGWVSQEPFLFAGTVRENLDPEGTLSTGELEKLLARIGILATVERIGGLEAPLLERGRNISAGERQLLCLARALVPNPGILLLDEATSRLDAATETLVSAGMAAAGKGRTVLIIAHRLRSIPPGARIAVMHRGRLAEEGLHEELLGRGGYYSRLWRLQELGGEVLRPGGTELLSSGRKSSDQPPSPVL